MRPFFWLALVVSVTGSMGIGLTIASLAKTQRAASMGAMCYMMAIAARSSSSVSREQHPRPALAGPGISLPAHHPRRPHQQRALVSLGRSRSCRPPRRCLSHGGGNTLPAARLAMSPFLLMASPSLHLSCSNYR